MHGLYNFSYGQNISIIIELSCSSGMKTIKSGWKVHSLGLITFYGEIEYGKI